MQQSLFSPQSKNQYNILQPDITQKDITKFCRKISGLKYVNNYISKQEEVKLLNWVDSNNWLEDLTRRVQHYGWKYDYKARKIDKSMRLGILPPKLQVLATQIYQDGLTGVLPDQVIVNEYQVGQGIASHIDCETCFSNDIVTLSLHSGCIMEFTRAKKMSNKSDKKKFMASKTTPVWLSGRSIVVMRGDARWLWFHGIKPRQSDTWKNTSYPRSRRVSLTFRKIIK